MPIRRTLPGDAPGIATLLGELGYPTSARAVSARLERLGGSENDPAWVAVGPDTQDSLLGFAAGHLFWPYELDKPVAELTALVVAERHRGTGAGRSLVAAFEEWARTAGCLRATVASSFHRTGAHDFYERLGYGQRSKKFEKLL